MGSKLYYTASGIVTPVGGRSVHRMRDMIKLIIAIRNVAKRSQTPFFSKFIILPLLTKVTVNGEAHISHICEVQGSYLLEDTGYHYWFLLDFTTRQ